MGKIVSFILFLVLSAYLYYQWFVAISGRKRCWRFAPNIRFRTMNTIGFGMGWFIGMTAFLLGPIPLPTEGLTLETFLLAYMGIPLICVLLMIVEPPFVKPKWLRWFENSGYAHLSPFIIRDVKEKGCNPWEHQTQTDTAFKNYVENMESRYKQAIDILQHERKTLSVDEIARIMEQKDA